MAASIFLAVVLASHEARAQTTNASASDAAEQHAWSFSVQAYAFGLADDRHYLQPTVTADRSWLHLEARQNNEGRETGSAWIGVNFNGSPWRLRTGFGSAW